jgi:hypothetical protein
MQVGDVLLAQRVAAGFEIGEAVVIRVSSVLVASRRRAASRWIGRNP